MSSQVLFLVGPTASGKSRIAAAAARKLGGEIVSADSMLIYRGMNIGTAKPSDAELKKIPHHLINILSPSRNYSFFQYRNQAIRKIAAIVKKGTLPIVAGGTGLYVRALLRGIDAQPGADLKLRRRLSNEAKLPGGLTVLYEKLTKKDPLRAEQIKPTDERRIIRALEVFEIRSRDSERVVAKRPSLFELGYRPIVLGITKDRANLYQDIEKRVDSMFRKGLVKEVKTLLKQGLSRTASQAVGYKEVISALRGECSMEEAKELIKRNTRHLAKRQWTWFKREEGIEWITFESQDQFKGIIQKIVKKVRPDSN